MKRPDLILAAVIFFLGNFGGYLAYREIQQNLDAQSAGLGNIRRGTHHYHLRLGDGCAGFMETSLMENPTDDNLELNSSGSIRASLGGREITATITAQAVFNPLNQLGGSLVRINSDDAEVTLGTTDINPIEVRIRTRLREHNLQRSFKIPGPIELRPGSTPGSTRLEYPYLNNLQQLPLTATQLGTIGTFGAKVVEAEGPCSIDSAVDLSPLLKHLTQIQPGGYGKWFQPF